MAEELLDCLARFCHLSDLYQIYTYITFSFLHCFKQNAQLLLTKLYIVLLLMNVYISAFFYCMVIATVASVTPFHSRLFCKALSHIETYL